MKSTYLLMPLLCATPMLQSCTTVAGSVATYGMKSVLEARNSSESPEMYYQVGRYAQQQNRLDAAARAYEYALTLKSDYVEASNALATVYALQGRFDLAVQRLDKAVKDDPRSAYLENNLGYVLYLKGDALQAIPHLERAVALDPDFARAHSNLALAYGKAGNAQLAGEHHARAVQLARLADAVQQSARSPTAPHTRAIATQESAVPAARAAQPLAAPPYRAAAPAAAGTAASGTALGAINAEPRTAMGLINVQPGAAMGLMQVAPGAAMGLIQVAPNIYELRSPAAQVRRPITTEALAARAEVKAPVAEMRSFRLEISNGNGTAGMARRVATSLRHAGLTPVRLTNQKPYQRITEIQYGPGYALEAARLAALLRQQAMMIRSDKLRPDIKVRLVLGRDVKDETALLGVPVDAHKTNLASVN